MRYHRVLARIDTHLERYPAAVEAYGKAIDVRPDSVELWRERTQLQERLLRWDEAGAGYEKLYELTYEEPQWMERIARIRVRQGRVDEARSALEKALIENRPERPQNFFAAASRLREWGLPDDALVYAVRGVGLAGDRLVLDENAGATLYLELMAEQRRLAEGIDRVRQSRPSEANDFWIYRFESALAGALQRARELYTPEERVDLAAELDRVYQGANPAEREQALLPAVRAAGLASVEADWLARSLRDNPAIGNWMSVRQRLIELQSARMQHAELGRQLEAHWQAHPTRNQQRHLLNEAAEAYRIAGLTDDEFRVLEAAGGSAWEERYYELLLERNPDRLVALSRDRSRAAEYAELRGDAEIASRAVDSYGARRTTAWRRAYQALTGLFHSSADERYNDAFQSALGGGTIGERVGQAVDRDQRLAGDVWFYYGARFGEYRAITNRPDADDYLPAEVENVPARASGYFELGERYADFNNPDQAAANYRLALELNEGDPRPHARLASIALAAGRRDEALDHWRQALAGYSSRVQRGTFGPEFWNEAETLFATLNNANAFGELQSDVETLLRTYVKRNGYYRTGELLEAAFNNGMPLAELLALESDAPDPIGFLGVFADAGWLSDGERARAYERVIAKAQQQLDALPEEQRYYPREQLNEWRFRQLEFLLDRDDVAAARTALEAAGNDFAATLAAQRTPLWLRLAALTGRIDDALGDDAPVQPQSDQIAAAAEALRGHGHNAEAERLLEAFYAGRIARRDLAPAYFLGLAELRFRQGRGDDAEALLRRMTQIADEPFSQHLAAARLLAANDRTQAALSLIGERVQAAPWDRQARLLQARPANDSQALAALARDPAAEYDLRADAATGSGASGLGSAELDLLAANPAPSPAAARQPYFRRARLAAAQQADAATKAALLAEVLAINPETNDNAVRLELFDAAREASQDRTAVAALAPLLRNTPLQYSLDQPDSVFQERVEPPQADRWVVEGFLNQPGFDAARRAALAAELAQALESLDRLEAAGMAYRIAYQLEPTAERDEASRRVLEARERRAENARRRPRITDNLDQPEKVRPRLALEAQP